MKYDIIYADPPWRNPKSGTNARNNEKHYPSMSTDEICNLPVKEIGTYRSILWIWCVFPNLPDVFRVMEAWGYEYYGLGFDWCKTKADGTPKIGCGYYTRQNNELCLIGVKPGLKNRIKPMVKNVGCSILEPAREHSRKPASVRDKIVEICGDLPRIELFAREKTDGWDVWGNEVNGLEALYDDTSN